MLIKISDISNTSVDFIDKDHKQLVDSINTLWQILEKHTAQDNDNSLITEKLREITTHLHDHFEHEETLMEESCFPGIEQHKNEHQLFLAKMNKACSDFFDTRDINRLKKFISKSLKRDFLDHIMVADSVTSGFYLLSREKAG